MLKAQALAASPAVGSHEVQAALDAAMDLFQQASARQVKVHPAGPNNLWCWLCHGAHQSMPEAAMAGQGACNTPGSGETDS